MSKPWSKVKLGDILVPTVRGESVDALKEYRLLGIRLDGNGVFLREKVMGSQSSATKLFRVQKGDFVYSRLFASRGAFGVIADDFDGCYVSSEFPAFRPDSERLDIEFIKYWFRLPGVIAHVEEDCTGSTPLTRNRFKENFFLALEIPLPPLSEQRRILARIEEVAEQINEARTLRHLTIEEGDTLLTAARQAVFLECDSDPVALEDVCVAIIDNLHSNPRLSEAGIPCLRSPDVGYGTINLNAAQRTDEAEYLRRTVRGVPQTNDIVLVREGGGTGKCAVVLPDQKFSLGQRVMMLRPDKTKILPRFFLHQLLSPLVQQDQIGRLSKGSASPHLNISALRRFSLRLPILSEQRRIVVELDAVQSEVDALKRLQEGTSKELDALLPSILDKAFKGEL